jgi:hypothetical protein
MNRPLSSPDVAPPAAQLTLEERPGSRIDARELLDEHLPDDLSGNRVTINGVALAAVASSFMDELVKGILVERRAEELIVVGAPEAANFYALASAQRREVAERLTIRNS